ncbi:SGNH/GDSL hydrolase family protein [Streptomyces sp. NPDC058417]|uniref:SGNH/GDSL hydrolase family protein n=1 Tax=unclassified Streptomyces TaxID=2593676 RepID=UPI00364A1BD4
MAAVVAVLALAAAGAPAQSLPGHSPAAPPGAGTVVTWASAPQSLGGSFADKTTRNVVHTSIGGSHVRVRLSNAYGTVPVTFASVYAGLRASGADVVPGTHRKVTFGGRDSVTVPRGAHALSDPVPMTVAAGADLAVSVYLPGGSGNATGHAYGAQEAYYADGNTAGQDSGAGFPYRSRQFYWVDAVTVEPRRTASTVVTLGDSITEGHLSTVGANRRYPDHLAARLARGGRFGVANAGIGGNRVLADGAGDSALARLDRDVLSLPRVRTVIFLEGINDITWNATAEELIAGHLQVIARLHAAGVRVVGGTLTPFEGSGAYSPAREEQRTALNAWIRTEAPYDAVVDFDAATRDPAAPGRFRPEFDSGDHLHPGDAGYAAMAAAVDLGTL